MTAPMTIAYAAPRHTPPRIRSIRDVVKQHNDPGLGWLYRELADHLRRVGPSDLTTSEIAAFVGGMSTETARPKLALLVEEGLLVRHRKGRGAYVYSLPAPAIVEFAPVNSPFAPANPRPVPQKPGHETKKTPPLMNDMNKSMSDVDNLSGEGVAGESEQCRLIRTTDFNTPHKPGKPLLKLADQCANVPGSLDEVRRLVGLDKTHAAANPYAYLYSSLTNWLERQQDEHIPRPAKSAPGKYVAFVEDGLSDPEFPDTSPPATISKMETSAAPPSGPILYPEPSTPPPPPPAATDPATARAQAALVARYARTCPSVTTAALTRDGDHWTLKAASPDDAARMQAHHRYILAALRDTVGAASVEVVL
jgi:hypothetical protein